MPLAACSNGIKMYKQFVLHPANKNTWHKCAKFRQMDSDDYPSFFWAQRKYYILSRFVQQCKLRKIYTRYNNDCDLTMTPFAELPANFKIELVENRCIYTFNINDLVKIIYSALTTQSFGFIMPKLPANPYTNVEFRQETLYSIYARFGGKKVPRILWLFFECGFSVDKLKKYHRKALMRYAIDNSTNLDSVEDIREICRGYFNIHRGFPASRLYVIFRPYLVRYYRWNLVGCLQSKDELDLAIRGFSLYNPHFGSKGDGGFDDRHLEFAVFLSTPLLKNPEQFELAIQNKRNYESPWCVSLMPIFVSYMEEDGCEESEYDCYVDDESEEEEEEEDEDDELGSYGYD